VQGPAQSRDPLAWLEARGAQSDVIEGLRPFGGDWSTLYEKCPRGDWLLGVATRLGVERPHLVRAAVACARTSLDRCEGESAARLLDVAERWARGEATAAEVAAATHALEASAASVREPSADAASRAALAVGLGIEDPDVLASAAAFAAEATIVATMECGVELAMGWAHRACADAVRAAIPFAELEQRTKVA